MTVSPEYSQSNRQRAHEGHVRFELSERLARDVLGRTMTSHAYDMHRRLHGGFFVTVPHAVSYVDNGMASDKRDNEVTFRERARHIRQASFQAWPQSVGPEIERLAVLYPKKRDTQCVAVATVPDDASYEKIAHLVGARSIENDESMRLELIPRIVISLGGVAVMDEFQHEGHAKLNLMQKIVSEFNESNHDGEYRLRVPAIFVPEPQRSNRS